MTNLNFFTWSTHNAFILHNGDANDISLFNWYNLPGNIKIKSCDPCIGGKGEVKNANKKQIKERALNS